METSPAIEYTTRKTEIKPAFDLTSPIVSKDIAVCLMQIEKSGSGDEVTNQLLNEQQKRMELLFGEEREGESEKALRERLLNSVNQKLRDKNVSPDEKKDLLNDKNFLNSLFDKVDSWRDPLTGLYTRRGFTNVMKLALDNPALFFGEKHGEVTQKGFSIMILDVDFFKNINDRLGHREGDNALVQFGQNIKDTVRSTDLIIRLGGEEVAILALVTDANDATLVDTKISDRVGRIKLGKEGKNIGFTYSVGVDNKKTWDELEEAVRSDDQLALSDFFEDADKALYKAKESGRNRISVAGD